MPDMYDVTVRMPVHLDSPGETAGFIQAAVTEAMSRKGWAGEAFVIYRELDGTWTAFGDGGMHVPYYGVLPHKPVHVGGVDA